MKKMAFLLTGLILMSLPVGCRIDKEPNRPELGTARAEALAWDEPSGPRHPLQVRPLDTVIPTTGCEVPWRLREHAPTVAVYINNRGPFRLVVDTGFTCLLLARQTAFSLELQLPPSPPETGVNIEGFGQSVHTGAPRRVASLKIGEAEFRQIDACVANIDSLFRAGSLPADGIVGIGVFADCIITLDYVHHCLHLDPGAEINGSEVSGKKGMTARFHKETPYVEVLFNGKPQWLLVDSGSNLGLAVSSSAARSLVLRYGGTYRSLATLQGKVQGRTAMLAGEARIGDLRLQNPTVFVGPENLIGWEVLRDCILTIDRARQTVSLTAPTLATNGDGAHVR